MKLAFVTNFCPHYRIKTFELLAQHYDVDFVFFSAGHEWYWQPSHGVQTGAFRHTYLASLRRARLVGVIPALAARLWRGHYHVFVKCINGRLALPVTYLIARLRGRPLILWTGIWMTLQTPFHRLAFPLTRWVYRHADAIVVYGEHVKDYLIGLDVAAEKIFVAPHAVDNTTYSRAVDAWEKTALRHKLGLENRPVLLYLGRLEEEKGVEYLIRAFAGLRDPHPVLVIAGDGSLLGHLKALARQYAIEENTRFVGYVPTEEAQLYYATADLFVLPSITMPTGKEPWGLVVNEAMNQGLPVVATDAVGAAAGGLVQSGVNGFVVPERDSVALAQAMRRILTDAELREQMSHNALRIMATWDNDQMVRGFQRAIEYVSQRRG